LPILKRIISSDRKEGWLSTGRVARMERRRKEGSSQ